MHVCMHACNLCYVMLCFCMCIYIYTHTYIYIYVTDHQTPFKVAFTALWVPAVAIVLELLIAVFSCVAIGSMVQQLGPRHSGSGSGLRLRQSGFRVRVFLPAFLI